MPRVSPPSCPRMPRSGTYNFLLCVLNRGSRRGDRPETRGNARAKGADLGTDNGEGLPGQPGQPVQGQVGPLRLLGDPPDVLQPLGDPRDLLNRASPEQLADGRLRAGAADLESLDDP